MDESLNQSNHTVEKMNPTRGRLIILLGLLVTTVALCIPLLRQNNTSNDYRTDAERIWSLAKSNNPDDFRLLKSYAQSENANTREWVAIAAPSKYDPKWAQVLGSLIDDTDNDVRITAVRSVLRWSDTVISMDKQIKVQDIEKARLYLKQKGGQAAIRLE